MFPCMSNSLVIVDDSADVQDDVHFVLESSGWRVTIYTSADLFRQQLVNQAVSPACVLLEPSLPGGSVSIAQVLSRDYPHVPVVGISATPESATAQKLIESGVRVVLRKPVSNAELLETLEGFSRAPDYIGPKW